MVEVWCHNTSCWCPAEVERANTSSVVTVMPNGSLDRVTDKTYLQYVFVRFTVIFSSPMTI